MNIVNLHRKYRMNNGTIIHLLAESTTASLPSLETAAPCV